MTKVTKVARGLIVAFFNCKFRPEDLVGGAVHIPC